MLLPGVFTFGSIVLIWGADGVAGFFPVSDVSQPDPRLSALNAFAGWPQLAVFVAVVALLIVAAFRPWWRRAIALIGWGISLLDVGCLFLITAVYPTY